MQIETPRLSEAGVAAPRDGDQEQMRRNEALIALLKAWEDDDPEDQRETWAVLQEALAHDRFNIPDRRSNV